MAGGSGPLHDSLLHLHEHDDRPPDHLVSDKHYAAFPVELPRRCILGWSPPGGIVLDPFGGTGTTSLAAVTHGRLGISCDLSQGYGLLAQWRVMDPSQRARAITREGK